MKIKQLRTVGSIFTVLMMSAPAIAQTHSLVDAVKVQEINQTIQQKGAKWQAKENWVSRLSQSEVRRMLGNNSMPAATLDFESAVNTHGAVDWRNQNGVNWLGPVMNQGNCGSCVAYSTVATLEAQVAISSGLPWLNPTFSPDQLFACGGGGCDSGWEPGDAASFLKSTGIVDAACAPPAMAQTGTDVSCAQTTTGCADLASRAFKITGTSRPSLGIFGGSVDKVKAALAKGPLETTLTVYTDFLTYSSGVYKHVTGKAEGGHAVSIVGYNDDGRYWIVRNSWGPTWGESGFIRVSWDDDSGVGSETWQFQVPTEKQYLSVQSPSENEYVSGQYAAKVDSNSPDNLQVEVRAAGASAKSANPVTLACVAGGTGCVTALDTTTLPDGRYELLAKVAGSKIFSQVRSFYVANSVPKNLTITFVGDAGVDMTQPLSDRPVFVVTSTASPNPFEHMSFVLRQNGKVIASRASDLVLPTMKIGFRTNTVPNGDYEILFEGVVHGAGKLYTIDSPAVKVTFKN
jgi:C1A family cysteine protease